MITKLSRKDIKMLESSVKNDVSKSALEEYLGARNKAETAWKVFRDSLVLSEALVKEENSKKKRKFKVGDKVRVLSVGNLSAVTFLREGDMATVVGYKEDYDDFVSVETGGTPAKPVIVKSKINGGVFTSNPTGFFEESALELVEEKTPNELRAEIIQRAKDFVEEKDGYGLIQLKLTGLSMRVVDINFVVNDKKRTVVALLNGFVHSKGIAKCNPDDVFNADIGKAIALGRALGKDVSEFENAVQPTKVVQGQVIVWKLYEEDALYRIDNRKGNQFNVTDIKTNEKYRNYEYREIEKYTSIVDDTNAQYSTSM